MLLSQSLTTLALNHKNYFFDANKEIHYGIKKEIEFSQFVATCFQIDLFLCLFSLTLIRSQVFVTFYLKNEW